MFLRPLKSSWTSSLIRSKMAYQSTSSSTLSSSSIISSWRSIRGFFLPLHLTDLKSWCRANFLNLDTGATPILVEFFSFLSFIPSLIASIRLWASWHLPQPLGRGSYEIFCKKVSRSEPKNNGGRPYILPLIHFSFFSSPPSIICLNKGACRVGPLTSIGKMLICIIFTFWHSCQTWTRKWKLVILLEIVCSGFKASALI